MKFELKQLHKDALPAALKKAEHYRLLNEPMQAESICRDILQLEPGHRQALITLVLALTDQFSGDAAARAEEARQLLGQLTDGYERSYYTGLVCERRATAYLERGSHGSAHLAYDWFRRAMDWYEKAEAASPPGNDDALLRWNTCARLIMQHRLEPAEEPAYHPALE
ncbi:MAG: hypothetical protein WEE89_17385 [Gemmatimonadota bacterium]